MRTVTASENRVFYLPPYNLLEITSVGFKEIMSEFLLFKTLVYYGDMLANDPKKVDWNWIYESFDASSKLDKYNIDTYYIAQAILTWQGKMVKKSTEILERGMKYRDWDWYLPFFVGFNYFYFFKDNEKAAENYRKGGVLNPELIQLAGRMYARADRTKVALAYLKGMLKDSHSSPIIRKGIENRIALIENGVVIQEALNKFTKKFKRFPKFMKEFIDKGILEKIPVDPHGRVFMVNKKGGIDLVAQKH